MSKNIQQESFGRFDFVKNIGLFGGISAVLVILSLLYLSINGIRYGIDFKGGTEIQVKFSKSVSIDDLRNSLSTLNIGDVGVQSFGDESEFIIRFIGESKATDKETNDNLNATIVKIKDMLGTKFSEQGVDVRRIDTVGPQVGAELKRNGFLAVFYCLLQTKGKIKGHSVS